MASKSSKYVARDQLFELSVSGLMPLTTHYLYFENNLVLAQNIKPFTKKLGDPIITDNNGQAFVSFYFNGGTVLDTTPFEQAQSLATKLASAKQIVIANKSVATLPDDYAETYLSYAIATIGVNITTQETTESVAAIFKTVEVPWDGAPAYDYEPAPFYNEWTGRYNERSHR